MFDFLKKNKQGEVHPMPQLSKEDLKMFDEIVEMVFGKVSPIQKMAVDKIIEASFSKGCMAGAVDVTELLLESGMVRKMGSVDVEQALKDLIKKTKSK